MKKLLLLSCLCVVISFSAFSQTVYLADTNFVTDVGYDGAPASCLAEHCAYYGWDNNRAEDQWTADVFTVPADSVWTFDTVIIYGIQKNSGTTSTFLNCNLEIYDGTPGLGGTVIWGDTSTNVLANTGFTGIYKVDTISSHGGLQSTADPIMYLKLYLSPAPALSSGSYWLSWSLAGSASSTPFSPDKVLPGRINPTGQMGRGLYGGTWQYNKDSGNVAGMDMIIKASAAALYVPKVTGTPGISLNQNVPNPFKGSTSISFYLPQAGNAKLEVYNTIGQLVATLVDGATNAGQHNVLFNTGNLPAGIYYYRLSTDAGVERKECLMAQ